MTGAIAIGFPTQTEAGARAAPVAEARKSGGSVRFEALGKT